MELQLLSEDLLTLTLNARIANHHSLSRLGQKYDVSQASGSSLRTRLAQYAALSAGPPAETGALIGAPAVLRGSCLDASGELEELEELEPEGSGRAEDATPLVRDTRSVLAATVAASIPRMRSDSGESRKSGGTLQSSKYTK